MGSTVQCDTWQGSRWDRNNLKRAFCDTGLQLGFPHFNVLFKPKFFVYLDSSALAITDKDLGEMVHDYMLCNVW